MVNTVASTLQASSINWPNQIFSTHQERSSILQKKFSSYLRRTFSQNQSTGKTWREALGIGIREEILIRTLTWSDKRFWNISRQLNSINFLEEAHQNHRELALTRREEWFRCRWEQEALRNTQELMMNQSRTLSHMGKQDKTSSSCPSSSKLRCLLFT